MSTTDRRDEQTANDGKALTKQQQRLAIAVFTRALNGESFRLGGNGKKVVAVPIEQQPPMKA